MLDGGDSRNRPEGTPPKRCSLCGKPMSERYRPFCSKRCADVDLARWLGGSYAIAGGNSDADEDGDDNGADAPGGKERPDADA